MMSSDNNEKKKNWFRRHKILTTLGAIIVLIIIISAAASGGSNSGSKSGTSDTTSSKKSSSATKTITAKLGEQANDGKLGFTATNFKCGITEIYQPDDTDLTYTSGAPYCTLDLAITGVGKEAQTFDPTSQYLYTADGTKYSVDTSATIYANPSSTDCEYPTVNPGSTVNCTLAFDVPASVSLSYAEFHDSGFSGGIKVSLQ